MPLRLLLLVALALSAGAYELDSGAYHVISDMDQAQTQRLAKMMDAYHLFLCETFAMEVAEGEERLILRIFSDRKGFENYSAQRGRNTPKWAAGTYYYADPNELVVHWNGSYTGIFFHEGFHQFAHRCWPQVAAWPKWFNEGCASYLETCRYTGGRITHRGELRDDYRTTFAETMRSHKDFDLTAFMAKRTNWNKTGYDYAVGACIIAGMFNGPPKLKAHCQGFFRTLRDTQSYEQAYTGFTTDFHLDRFLAYLVATYR